MRIKLFLVSIIIISSISWFIYDNLFKRENKAIYAAFIGPTETPAGKMMSQAVRLYFDSINEKGGVNGKELKLDLFDDQNDCGSDEKEESKAKEEALNLVKANKYVAVVGHWYSGCSIRGGKVYKKYAIPAITPGSVNVKVTAGNDWYFRSIFTSKASGQFLAHYIQKVFHQSNVTIIHETAAYGAYLAQVFEQTAVELGMQVKNQKSYDPNDPKLDDTFKQIVDDLVKVKDQAGVIFLAVQAGEGVKLVKRIKDAKIDNIIIGETSLSEQAFVEGFKDFSREKATPGFYTNDIYAATPLIFDTANEKAQKFKEEYKTRYGEDPDWSAAYAYDTAIVLVKAIKETEIRGEPETLKQDRQKIRDYLDTLKTPQEAVEGTTGFNYFDQDRNAKKPVVIGVYKNRQLISALTQLQVVRNLNEISDLDTAVKEERVVVIGDDHMYKTNVVYVGLKINEISKLDLAKLTYDLDFHLWFRFQGGFNPQDIEFLNAVEPKGLGVPVVDKIKDGITYRVYRVKQDFKADFTNQYLYKQHILGVTFRHRNLTRNNLIYVTDELGMGTTNEKNLLEQMKESQVLSPATGWMINSVLFFQDVAKKYSLGDPEFLNVQGGTVEYSRFNTLLHIQKSEFTLRGMIPYKYAYNLLIFSLLAMLGLNLVGSNKKFRQFSKLIWFPQTIFAFVLLLAGEVILVDWLAEKTNTYNLKLVIQLFDILWWLIPAFLLNLASERFIWTPLEEKTGRVIPNIVRLFLAFIIYFMACVGIIAFVYEQQLTSILATSGVIAMIIGLAIQINISNIFSGIAINLERPFRIGDWVKVGDFEEGKIVDITWRSTRLQTRADCILSIPNSQASESSILNYCYPDESFWLWPTIYVHPIHPPERVKKILLDALLSTQKILKDPAPVIIFTGINEWAAGYWVAFCANDYANKFFILEDVWTRIWYHLNRAGITPAVQRQEVYWFKGIKERGGEEATKPITLLQEVEIFKPFSTEAKQYLSEHIRRYRFQKDDTIVRQGDQGDSLFIIVEGVVGVRVASEGVTTEIARLGAGNIFGEMALLTGEHRKASVVAVADTMLYEITKADIRPLLEKQPEVTELISKVLVKRQLDFKDRVKGRNIVPETEKENLIDKIKKWLFTDD